MMIENDGALSTATTASEVAPPSTGTVLLF